MKKNYTLTVLFLLAGVLATAQTTSTIPTFVITQFNAPQDVEGIVHTESKYDAQIQVKLRNVTAKTWADSFSIYCIENGNFTDYPYVEMAKEGATDNSFVEIENLGEADIERIEYVMGAAGKISKLICAPALKSESGSADYLNSDYELESGESVYKRIQVDGFEDICDATFSYDVPKQIVNAWGGEDILNAREAIKFIRLDWGDGLFADAPNPDKGGSANIFAIKIYTNANTSTVGVEEQEAEKPNIRLYGRNLQLSEFADITIYDITGKIAAQYSDIDNAYLDVFDVGVYLIRATNKNGQNTTQKVVIR